jgi:hypothetical protein
MDDGAADAGRRARRCQWLSHDWASSSQDFKSTSQIRTTLPFQSKFALLELFKPTIITTVITVILLMRRSPEHISSERKFPAKHHRRNENIIIGLSSKKITLATKSGTLEVYDPICHGQHLHNNPLNTKILWFPDLGYDTSHHITSHDG